jgi:hypothetical protein
MSSLNTKKRKGSKSKRLAEARAEHEAWLKSMGITDKKSTYRYDIPDYSTKSSNLQTSDTICSNGTKKDRVKYTGDEIAGIVVTHKSNLMPIRKDNKQAAVDAASMRR